MFCIYLRTNSDLCHLQHKLIDFYNPDEKCLQRGADWVFKYSGLRLVCKGVTNITVEKFCKVGTLLSRRFATSDDASPSKTSGGGARTPSFTMKML